MAYTDNNTINLADVGAPEIEITYKRPGMMSYEKSMEFFSKHKQYNEKLTGQLVIQSIKEILDDVDANFAHSMSLITSWNIQDENGVTFPVPSEDSEVWKKIPSLYVVSIVRQIKEDPTGSDFLFKSLNQTSTDDTQDQQIEKSNGLLNSISTVKP